MQVLWMRYLRRRIKLYFKDIHTYTEEEFEEYARNLL